MPMSYNTFDKQKDSQINWVGDIPSHWLTSKIKNNFTFSKSTNTSKNPTILSLTLQGIKIRDITTNEGQIASSYDNYTKVYKNDIVMNPMDLISGFVDCSPVEGVISPAYYTLKPNKDIDPEYYKYYLQKHYYEKIFFPFAEGVSVDHRWTLKKEDFLNFSIIKPPLEEQKQIANYLDKKTSKIDTTIAKNKELISLLEEKRSALINQVVTKGLNPEVPMKDSGIEWIGEIPEHWKISKVKHELLFLDHKRVPLSAEVRSNIDKIYDYYGASGVIDKVDSYLFDGKYILVGEDGANLLSRSTPLAFIAEGKFWVNNHAHILNPINNDIDYFAFLLEAVDYTPFIEGSAQPKLTADNLKNIIIIKPPIDEQEEISKYLNTNVNKINETIDKIKENIKLLEEYKTSLIHHVVTGKIDVRGEEI